MSPSLTSLALLLTLGPPAAAVGGGYLRHPAAGGGQVFFTAEGDLWRAPLAGGEARRLTTHPGQETRPAVSPDGAWVAFSASYEGPQEAYVMPAQGGAPKRLSFEGGSVQVLGWTPRGEVLFGAPAERGPASRRVLVTVHPGTLARRVLPLADVAEACLDGSGRRLFFTRMGLTVTGDNVRAYRGGAASELWCYDLTESREAVRIPFDAPLKRPMWHGDRLYVVCDRDGRDNLWSMKADGSDARQLTFHKDWDLRGASLGEGRIVYQLGADLRAFELATGRDLPLELRLGSDEDQARPRVLRRPLDYLDNAAFALNGERVALTARGQVLLAGLEGLRRVEVALPPASRAREAVLSRDGAWVYALCDAGGDLQVWRFPADGRPGGEALTREPGVTRAALHPSPDGQFLAHTDRDGRVYLLKLANGENRCIDTAPNGGSTDVTWAPDGKHLALVRPDSARNRNQILLVRAADGHKAPLSSDKYESYAPAFSPDGRWLFFLSDRHFQATNPSPWGDRNLGPFFDRRTQVFALALQEGLRFPFQPRTELDVPESREAGKPEPKGKSPEPPAPVWEGLAERLFEVPLPPGNYAGLRTDGKRLYLLDRQPQSSALKSAEIGPRPSLETFAPDVAGFELSADGRKLMFVRRGPAGRSFHIVEAGAKAPSELAKSEVRVGDWSLAVDPRTEWRQMFQDAWRMHREHFYDARMRGLDWEGLRRKYEPLVDRIRDRAELDDLLGQMMGELGALHSQIRPGDQRQAQDGAAPAFLGAVLERVADGFRIAHIYRTEPELPSEAGPLAQPGLDVREGDVITAVNGRPVREARHISDLLQGRAGEPVLLALQREGKPQKPVLVKPVDAQRQSHLRYADWEEACRRTVAQASGGRIGYLHLRAMGPLDIATFARDFYGQFDREGLILDVRRNNGGNIDSWVIEKLLRRAWAFWTDRKGRFLDTNMQQAFRGHLVVLVDELTYSDGESFAAGIKALGLGPLVGRRTAGAGVWLGDSNRLMDGGQARAAETPQYAAKDGAWIIEGVGVSPDVEVVNPPRATFEGRDLQLEKALALLQERLREAPVKPLKASGVPTLASGQRARD